MSDRKLSNNPPMTEEEILDKMNFLDQLLGALDNQINAIAAREAAAAVAQHPLPYSNPALTHTKERLVEKSSQIIGKLQELHAQLVSSETT